MAKRTMSDNKTMTTRLLPLIEHEPPYSMAFVSHLHAGYYTPAPLPRICRRFAATPTAPA
ncbi:hypothetical protein A5639_24440 [Mycolicibacterium conceptionense]|nr:hypothetical protein A5639_24440 [Mycolicibacterium conceptionense]